MFSCLVNVFFLFIYVSRVNHTLYIYIYKKYKSKYNLNRENQVILLMITDGKKWHYLAVKKLSALLRGITSKHVGDFYCLNCFHSYSTKDKLKKHKDVCENHDY